MSTGEVNTRLLVMSDIHGEYEVMRRVLQKAAYDPDKDKLVLLGDYIDRGPASSKVVDVVKQLVIKGAIALRGNHEQLMIDALETGSAKLWNYNGGRHTVNSYTSMAQMQIDAGFFKTLPFYYETDDFIFVHGGIIPGTPLKEQTERVMLWARPEEFGFYEGKPLVVGHTPSQTIIGRNWHEPFQSGDIIFIDTGMGNKQRLTLLELPKKVYWQSDHNDRSRGLEGPKKMEVWP